MFDWTHSGATVLAAFLASLVEFVEALTIVLAVGTARGWRPALTGAAGGAALLAVLVIAFGPLLDRVPIAWLQLSVGILLLLFGMRWLRRAVLRAAGIVPLHDEDAIYRGEALQMRQAGATHGAWDAIALAASFKAVVLEGLEVVFIVLAIGVVGDRLAAASAGAALALILVVAVGAAIHRPLARVPENSLKFTVGVLLSAFGTFWIGEGLRFTWPGEDLAILGLVAFFLAVALVSVGMCRQVIAVPTSQQEN
jgi:uncharacterized membrane protein